MAYNDISDRVRISHRPKEHRVIVQYKVGDEWQDVMVWDTDVDRNAYTHALDYARKLAKEGLK